MANLNENKTRNPIKYFVRLGSRISLVKLLVGWLALLAIPYAYLYLCGLVVDTWLKWYEGGVIFTAITLALFWMINIFIGILLTVGFAGKNKKRG